VKRIALFLCLVGFCRAQPSPTIEGEIVSDQPADFSHLTVRLEDSQHRDAPITASVTLHGEFRLSGVPNGLYTLRVVDERGNDIASDLLNVSMVTHNVTVRLPSDATPRPGGPVSLARLSHKPDRRAFQAAIRAQKFADNGDRDEAVAALSKAVTLDPQFTDAWNNLGVEYIRATRYADAVSALEKAVALDSACARCYSNLAMALLRVERLDEAEAAARRSVQLDPTVEASHHVLNAAVAALRSRARP